MAGLDGVVVFAGGGEFVDVDGAGGEVAGGRGAGGDGDVDGGGEVDADGGGVMVLLDGAVELLDGGELVMLAPEILQAAKLTLLFYVPDMYNICVSLSRIVERERRCNFN